MQIRYIFKKNLYDIELFSNEDLGGDYQLKIGQMIIPSPVDCSEEIDNSPIYSKSLKADLVKLYGEIRELSVYWILEGEDSDAHLARNQWVKGSYLNKGVSLPIIKEYLNGTVNISSFEYLTKDQEHLSYLKKGSTEYLPFDRHWSLTACLKKENGVVVRQKKMAKSGFEAISWNTI